MRTIDRPGIYELTMAEYLADPVGPAPSLSASIAHLLISRSPAHARRQHPRLSPDFVPEESDAFDLGTAAHAYVLEGGFNLEIIDALDWRTQAARAARDAARAAGKTPVLAHRFVLVQAMAEAAREQLARHAARPIPLTNGQAERTLVWQEEGVWCRARLDWLHEDHRMVDDYKTLPERQSRGLHALALRVRVFGAGGLLSTRDGRGVRGSGARLSLHRPGNFPALRAGGDGARARCHGAGREAGRLCDWPLARVPGPAASGRGTRRRSRMPSYPPWLEASWLAARRKRRRHGEHAGRLTPELFWARFWARVVKTETCWEWRGAYLSDGYGQFEC